MNGNFRNSYRGGWNGTPFDNFSREQFNYNYQIPHDWGFHYAHDMHLPYQTPAHYYDMSHPTHQMSAHYPDMRPLPHQVPATIPFKKQRVPLCEICHVRVPSKDIELHNNGKKHRRNLELKECVTSKGEVSGHIQNSQMNPVVLPKEVPKSMKDGRPVENMSQFRCNDVPAEGCKKLEDHAVPKDQMPKPTIPSDKKCLPHQMPKPTVENMSQFRCKEVPAEGCKKLEDHAVPKDQMPKPTIPSDKKCLPHQMPKPTIPSDKKCLPHQMPKSTIPSDKKCLPPQMPKPTIPSDKKCLPSQMPKPTIPSDKMCLPPQMPKPTFPSDKKCLPPQMPKPTIPSDKKCSLRCEICHVTISPNYVEQHNNGRKHRRNLKSKECKISKGEVSGHIQNSQMNPVLQPKEVPKSMKDGQPVENMSQFRCKEVPAERCKKLEDHAVAKDQMPKPTIPSDKKCLPHQMPKPTNPSKKKRAPLCEICHVMVPTKDIELHNNGKKHQRNLKLKECKISKGKVSGLAQNPQMNPVVQPKEVPKSMKVGCPVENMSQFRCKEVPAEGSKRKLEDQTVAKDHGFKVKKLKNESPSFKNKKVPAEKRKVSDNTDAKDHDSNPEIGETGAKYMKMNSGIRRPVKSSKSESPHVSASLSKESKGKEHHKFQKTVEKNDQPQSTPVELNASEGSNRKESTSCDFAAIPLPQVPMNCPVFTPSPAVESSIEPSIQTDSQVEVEEGKEHHGVQNCGVETNDQPQSITMELHANGGSDINTLIKEDTCSDSGAIVIIPSQLPIASKVATAAAAVESSYEPESPQVKQTEMSDDKVHNEILDHTVDSNDQQQSISMELDDPAGCMTSTQTEVVNSDSAVIGIVIDPLAYALPDAVWSGFEPLTDTEIEPQVSEAVVYNESHHPIDEIDIELPPSVSMEIDASSEVSTKTETADGSPQAEVEMDVLADELGIIQLPQVSVCLTCGDEGFEEAILYCYKCKGYAIHRYCLDGPVIFTEEVIWFCADCKEEVIDTDYPDQVTSDSEKVEVDCSDRCVTVVDPQPIADPTWRGSLQVSHKSDDKITRLMAHLSTLACPKVLEETRHLPNVLYGNLLQRSAVWPASFTKFGTNNLSIGLYLFPQNESAERYYDQLVDEIISNDLAISARFEKSELLIFASTMLPSQYKRFQSKYYLWGIFKRKQAANTIKDS